MTSLDQAAAYITGRYTAAVRDQDVDALLVLYAGDARIFDLFDEWSYEGQVSWRAAIDAWFGSVADGQYVRVSFDDVRTVGSDDVAAVSALITYAEVDDAGVTGNEMKNRLSWTLQRRDDAWVILHEHTSVPISGETFAGRFEP